MIYKHRISPMTMEYLDDEDNPTFCADYWEAREGYYTFVGETDNIKNPITYEYRANEDSTSYVNNTKDVSIGGAFVKYIFPKNDEFIYMYPNKNGDPAGFFWVYNYQNKTFKVFKKDPNAAKSELKYNITGLGLEIMEYVYKKTCATGMQRFYEACFKQFNYDNGRYVGVAFIANSSRINGEYHVEYAPTLFGKLSWNNNNLYIGEFSVGKRHGFGYFEWNNGTIYYGDFIENALYGWGNMEFASGDYYEGTFMNGERHGWGMYFWHDKDGNITDRYIGEWRHNNREGYGTYFYANGKIERGQFQNNRYIG